MDCLTELCDSVLVTLLFSNKTFINDEQTLSQRAIWGSKTDTTVIRMRDWSFYQIGVSENGGSPKSRNQNKARTSEELKNHPLFLSPFPSFYPLVRRPNGLSCFRAFGAKQAEALRVIRVR